MLLQLLKVITLLFILYFHSNIIKLLTGSIPVLKKSIKLNLFRSNFKEVCFLVKIQNAKNWCA